MQVKPAARSSPYSAAVSSNNITNVVPLSIEDFTGDEANPLYDFDLAVARVRAARDAIDEGGGDVLLTGRSEGFIHGRSDMNETILRLKAYANAGADCLYAPGIKTREQIEAVVKAVTPKPVNLLMSAAGFTVEEIAAMGVRRISVGGTLARVAMQAFISSAREIAEQGCFDSFSRVVSNAELNTFFHYFEPNDSLPTLSNDLIKELKKMKKDFYYQSENPDIAFMPGPGWTVRGRHAAPVGIRLPQG